MISSTLRRATKAVSIRLRRRRWIGAPTGTKASRALCARGLGYGWPFMGGRGFRGRCDFQGPVSIGDHPHGLRQQLIEIRGCKLATQMKHDDAVERRPNHHCDRVGVAVQYAHFDQPMEM